VALPGPWEAWYERDAVEVRGAAPSPGPVAATAVDGPGRYELPGGAGTVEIAWEAPGPPPWPLELRSRCPGDRFRPERGRGEKKLKAWLIDRKVPRARRDSLVLLVAGRGQVLAIPELGARAAGAAGLAVRYTRRAGVERP
jgi:tRNA(Ile)-lysidine synthase